MKAKTKKKVSNIMITVIGSIIVLYTAASFVLQYFTRVLPTEYPEYFLQPDSTAVEVTTTATPPATSAPSSRPILAPSDTWFSQGGTTISRSSITEIDIKDTYTPTGVVTSSWDASAAKDGSVMVYIESTKLTVAGNGYGKIYMNADSSRLFSNVDTTNQFRNVLSITGLSLLDASGVTDMSRMFQCCTSLQTVDVSSWNTSSVKDMSRMFMYCYALKTIDVSNFDTSNVTTFECMFNSCFALSTLDVSNWDTRSCITMRNMFASKNQNSGDMSLAELDISKWNTSKVTDFDSMFYGCGQLKKLDLSCWDVSKVTTMSHMFADCFKMEQYNFTGWNTASLTNMDAMFNDNRALIYIDVSAFDTENIVVLSQLFENCVSLNTIVGLEAFNTAKCEAFSEMFKNCYSLSELNLSSFDTTAATDGGYVYDDGYNTPILYVALTDLFYGMTSLEKITLGENFSFSGDGTVATHALLPTPSDSNIPGADGNWHIASGTSYAPADVPNRTAATYYANPEAVEDF